ncbi:MAG TPA: hypothetical protein VJ730_01145 [Nitrososphaera sp.]|nr:hypothetical protein [Nitrososphaera sp.]
MSKKKRDDSYFAAGRRRNRKYMMIIIPIVAAVAVAGIAAAVLTPRSADFGPLGSAHVHAIFAVKLDGENIDFSQRQYQVGSTGNQYIHFEGNDGTTVHRHSTKVPIGEYLRSVDMDIREGCFVLDSGEQFCNDGKKLRFFVNGEEESSIMDYILQDEDRILIIYGDEEQSELQAEFDRLDDTPIEK